MENKAVGKAAEPQAAESKAEKKSARRILVVEDEDAFREALKNILVASGYEIKTAMNGKAATELMGVEKFDAVISDIHMPTSKVNGVELLHFIKQKFKVPVVLMTGFTELAETKEAYTAGAEGFLAKPFKKDELLSILKSFFKKDDFKKSDCGINYEGEYSKLSIDDFIFGKQINFGIYIRLAHNRFVKIAHRGEDLPAERIYSYKLKGIRFLYLTKEEFKKYYQFTVMLTKAAVTSPNLNSNKKLTLAKHTTDVILEKMCSTEINEDDLDSAMAITESVLDILMDSSNILGLLETIKNSSDQLYAHSIAVSMYACLVAKKLGWNSPQTLSKISIAGMFHDIGMKEIDSAILDKKRSELKGSEVKALEAHVAKGVEILSKSSCFSDDILQIIKQHHENNIGTGYPLKLTKSRIHPVARLIAVCDEFCDLVIGEGKEQSKITPREAVKRIFLLHYETMDSNFLHPLAQIVGLDPKDLINNKTNAKVKLV